MTKHNIQIIGHLETENASYWASGVYVAEKTNGHVELTMVSLRQIAQIGKLEAMAMKIEPHKGFKSLTINDTVWETETGRIKDAVMTEDGRLKVTQELYSKYGHLFETHTYN
jgi:hypothetical protein